MRMDKVVKFYQEGHRTGEIKLVGVDMANVTDVGVDRSAKVLGNLNQRSLVVRTLHSPVAAFSYLTIDDGPKRYRLTTGRQPLKGNTMIVGEDIG